jgi:hypothetical protein
VSSTSTELPTLGALLPLLDGAMSLPQPMTIVDAAMAREARATRLIRNVTGSFHGVPNSQFPPEDVVKRAAGPRVRRNDEVVPAHAAHLSSHGSEVPEVVRATYLGLMALIEPRHLPILESTVNLSASMPPVDA